MGVLNRKLRRDIRENMGILITVVAIIAVGTGLFVGLRSAQRILETSQRAYYAEYRFADFWIDVKKAPLGAVDPLRNLPGVAELETRVIFDVILDLPGVRQPLTGRLISLPEHDSDRTINGIYMVRGSGFSDDRAEEVILAEAFAQAHGLDPGDRIQLILNRKRESFVIAGTAISPEYVYMVRGEGDIVPDPEHFGVLYVKDRYAREVLDFEDACNQIVGRLVPGCEGEVDALLDRMERMLDAYGVLATTPRARHASHRFLSDEIAGLGVTAVVMPAIFLFVAALVLNIVMSRFAEKQRVIIGTLKATGYSNRQVFVHFLGFGLAVGFLGGLAGIGVGLALAYSMIEMYKDFFQFPVFLFAAYPNLLLTAMGMSVLFAVAGTAKGVWAVLKLPPAEAMRGKPPERGGSVFLERFPGLWNLFGFRTHMAIRSIFRNRGRTITGVISSALAISLILVTMVLYDSMWFMIEFQFERVLHSDVDIGLRDEKSTSALLEASELPGVDYAEPVLGVICDLRLGRRSRRLAISGLSVDRRLTTPMQMDFRPIDIPPSGLVLSRKLAEILEAEIGDDLELTPVRGRRETVMVPVVALVDGFLGLDCYADLEYLSRIVGESIAVNSVQLSVDPTRTRDLFAAIKELPNAQGLNVRSQAKSNIESTFVKSMAFSLGLTVVFAGVILFGTMLNTSLIEIVDRRRQIATLHVMGYRPGQIAGIFFRENLIVFLAGLALSMPIGWVLIQLTARAYDTELFRMPVIFNAATIMTAVMLSMVFIFIVQIVVYRQIAKFDWLEGIQVKE